MDTTAANWYSNRVNLYDLRLRVWTIENNTAGNYSRYRWTLTARSLSGYGSWTGTARTWNVSVAGQWWSGQAALNFLPDSPGKTIQIASGETSPVGHAADGTLGFQIGANHGVTNPPGPLPTFGSADIGMRWVSGDSLAQPPLPPTLGAPFNITARSFGVPFTVGAERGAAITETQLTWSRNPEFTDIAWVDRLFTRGSGYSDPAGVGLLLDPGREYWVRAQSDAYGIGWSGLSNVVSARTLAGARVKVGGAWQNALIWVKVNDQWRQTRPLVKHNGTWRPTA